MKIGEVDGLDVVTITGGEDVLEEKNAPCERYLECIKNGLRETYPELSDDAIEAYLREAVARP